MHSLASFILLGAVALQYLLFSETVAVTAGKALLADRLGPTGAPFVPDPKYQFPSAFQEKWKIFSRLEELPVPPYKNGIIPEPYVMGTGATYYDWPAKSMLEVYDDFCVPIFVNGSNWRCHFLNTGGIVHLITFDDRPAWVPECCIFGDEPYDPPPPWFAGYLNYTGVRSFHDEEVAWYIKTFDDGLTFGFAFYTSTGYPADYFFNGNKGWAVQHFYDVEATTPPKSTWTIPPACANAKPCNLPH